MQLVAEGKTNRQVGEILYLAEDSVKAHLRKISKAWGVRTRGELAPVAVQEGYVPCPNCRHAPGTVRLLASTATSLRELAARLDLTVAQIANRGDDRG